MARKLYQRGCEKRGKDTSSEETWMGRGEQDINYQRGVARWGRMLYQKAMERGGRIISEGVG